MVRQRDGEMDFFTKREREKEIKEKRYRLNKEKRFSLNKEKKRKDLV